MKVSVIITYDYVFTGFGDVYTITTPVDETHNSVLIPVLAERAKALEFLSPKGLKIKA